MRPNLITAEGISRSFSETNARGIFDFSLSVEKGEIVCILGPSGSGKSTLLRVLAGLEKTDGGTLSVAAEARSPGEMVYVPQDYTLWPHLTVLENLVLAPREVRGLPEREVKDEAESLLARFGLEHYGSTYPNELSGGQKQRVALIRALMMRPAVLLLDEVTSALDPELTKSVLDMIRALAKDGYTMIVVTHHISLALAIADRIVFLDEGKVKQDTKAVSFFHGQTDSRILSFIQDIAKRDHAVEIFEGEEQFQAYHMGLLKRLPEGAVIHVAGAVGDRWFEPMGAFAQAYTALRIEKNIVWKMAMYEFGTKDRELIEQHPKLNDFRLLPRTLSNPANYNVMGDTVIIQIFGENPAIMEIQDASVAEAYLTFFEEMWSVSAPIRT
jgi:polar amino acid transport system ATP-binding protein